MKKSKRIALAILLFLLTMLFGLGYGYYEKKFPLLTTVTTYSRDTLIIPRNGELLAGDIVKGEFKSNDNFLGIVEIRFEFYERKTEDSYIFRIKEKSQKEWYHTNTYKAKEFGGYPLFPFGFPVVTNSRGKDYYFELESLHGKPGHGVGISTAEPVIEVRHIFTKEYLLSNNDELLVLTIKKIWEMFFGTKAFYFFIVLYVILLTPFFVKINFSKITVAPLTFRLSQYSKKESRVFNRMFIQMQLRTVIIIRFLLYVFLFLIKKVYSFHQWLGAKE